MNPFSFNEYEKIIKYYKKFLKPLSFEKVTSATQDFFIIRHDIEFSVQRAFALAELEKKELKINSCFFFQLTNNSYNLLSYENKKILFKIKKLGHKIGLHFNYKGIFSKKKIIKELKKQISIFNKQFENSFNFYSPHRPSSFPYLLNVKLNKINNTYHPNFFTHYTKAIKDSSKTIYLVDSRHCWKYKHPLNLDLTKHRKVQLVFHPDAWTKKGHKIKENYNKLRDEKKREFNQTLLNETDYL